MSLQQLAITIITLLLSIVSYFLKRLFEKIEKHNDIIADHSTSIRVIQSENNALNNRMDELFIAIKELSSEIKQLSKEISKKKDNV